MYRNRRGKGIGVEVGTAKKYLTVIRREAIFFYPDEPSYRDGTFWTGVHETVLALYSSNGQREVGEHVSNIT